MKDNGEILKQVVKNCNYSKEQADATLNNAKKMYEKLPNSENELSSNVGLVVGKVQSGKTANVITLSALALDNGHKMIVLFLSDTNNLLQQNTERFKEAFKGIEGVTVFEKSSQGDFANLDTQTLNFLYRNDEKLIICSLKHSKHIDEVKKLIASSPYKDDYALIIDDEGDDIGLNSKGAKKKFKETSDGRLIEVERSATNEKIVDLKKTFSKLGYISLTATPEANVLLQDFQELAPDYCVTIEPNEDYTGLLTFHCEDSEHIVEVTDQNDFLEDNGIPSSFEDAFTYFVAGCIIRKQRHGKAAKHSMMVHPCKKITDHQLVFDKIEGYYTQVFCNLQHKNQSGKNFIKKVEQHFNLLLPNSPFSGDEVFEVIEGLKRHLVNSKAASNDLKKNMSLLPYHIIVGGDLLDRGITIDGLAVTYMFRMAKTGQVDTLLQRARWFGYKKSYIDLCRVYLPTRLKQQFYNLIEAEESVWQFLKYCDDNNICPKNEKTLFQLPTGMKPTASNKAHYITTSLIACTKVQSYIVQNNEYNAENISWVNSLDWSNGLDCSYNPHQIHKKLTISCDDFEKFIEKYHFSDLDKELNLEYIQTLLKRLKSKNVDLWDMRYQTGEQRSTTDYKINALLQGRSEGLSPTDPNYYVGDRYINTNNLSVQIHRVRLKNDISNADTGRQYKKGDEVIVLAFILPKDYVGGYAARRMTHAEIIDRL